jgi:hypothetical protein
VDDVKAWLLWTLRQYNLPMIHMEYFNMDGVALSALSEEEFQKRAPEVSLGITIQSHVLTDTEVLYACLTWVVHL